MPRVKLQKPTEAERLASIAADTQKVIRRAMIERDVPYMIDLAALIGMRNQTLSLKLKTGSWTQKDLCRLVAALHIPPEEAVRMLGVRLERRKEPGISAREMAALLLAQSGQIPEVLESPLTRCLAESSPKEAI